MLAQLLVALLFCMTVIGNLSHEASANPDGAIISPVLLENLQDEETVEFIIVLEQQADLSAVMSITNKVEKGRRVHRLLTEVAAATQAPVLHSLDEAGADYRPYWVANMIWARGDEITLRAVAAMPGVARIYANPAFLFDVPVALAPALPTSPQDIEPNIQHVNAPALWALGYTGEGVVIGGQDTGYEWDHPALINQYRGWDGASASHDYNWHDAIHSGDGPCGADSPEPCDDHGHGTHTMGTMVGDDGMGNQIGMAPAARWIGCRNMDRGVGTPITYAECFQWFVAPTDINGDHADPSMAPDVVNNSWACPPDEGCDEIERDILRTVVENVRAAGIVVVASAGNRGAGGCGTITYPPAIYDATFSIGATANDDTIATFSSRGPVTIDGSNLLKPDVVAPGVSIRSSTLNGAYTWSSGTSMASPHVAGLVALLIDVAPNLRGDVDANEQAIINGSKPLTTTETCGGIAGDQIPNNTYGHGRIDALSSYVHLMAAHWYYLPTPWVPAGETSNQQDE